MPQEKRREFTLQENELLKLVRKMRGGEVIEASLCFVLLGEEKRFIGGITANEISLIRDYAKTVGVTLSDWVHKI